ncbi:hypothetical protein BDZ89DRAFT_1073464 [Hymenopellis radicata]|nr:hypothetical protein BDZ89DRAFT_1073464 [Hymenopellis radicata]
MFSLALLWSGDRSWLVCDSVLHQTAWHLTARWSRKLKRPGQDILTNDACYFQVSQNVRALMRKCTALAH